MSVTERTTGEGLLHRSARSDSARQRAVGGIAFVGGSSLVSACENAQRRPRHGGVGSFTTRDIAFLDEVAETILRRPRAGRRREHGAFMA